MLKPGSRAPEFTLPDQEGRDTSLTALLNRGPLILYFYPADFTPGCTRQACAIRDLHFEILRAGLTIAGVSPQPSVRCSWRKARLAARRASAEAVAAAPSRKRSKSSPGSKSGDATVQPVPRARRLLMAVPRPKGAAA